MCRHLAYLGPPAPLARFLFDPPHSLVHQSWAPRDMRGGGTINADGFGAGWFGPDGRPVRYRRPTPMWSDTTLRDLGVVAPAFLAAVRSATEGMPVIETAAAPFAGDGTLFSHNGKVTGWPGSMAKLAAELPVTDLLTLEAPTDSALLWALIRAGRSLPAVVADVLAAAPGSRLNLLLTDGHRIEATTVGHSLSYLAAKGSVLVASEPLDDDPGWRAVPDRTVLTATRDTVTLLPLEDA
jgi:gamma-glutamyl hercynylcysteine S-oxide hydrolase